VSFGEKHAVRATDGQGADWIIHDLIARTPNVMQRVTESLPGEFPNWLAENIFHGLQTAAHKLSKYLHPTTYWVIIDRSIHRGSRTSV
jgi:serine/threonine-protein kinase HipA